MNVTAFMKDKPVVMGVFGCNYLCVATFCSIIHYPLR